MTEVQQDLGADPPIVGDEVTKQETFITGVNVNQSTEKSATQAAGAGVLAQHKRPLVLESVPGAGPRIMQYFSKLQNLAETLDLSVSSLLQEHEKDFFLAYKTHMYGT